MAAKFSLRYLVILQLLCLVAGYGHRPATSGDTGFIWSTATTPFPWWRSSTTPHSWWRSGSTTPHSWGSRWSWHSNTTAPTPGSTLWWCATAPSWFSSSWWESSTSTTPHDPHHWWWWWRRHSTPSRSSTPTRPWWWMPSTSTERPWWKPKRPTFPYRKSSAWDTTPSPTPSRATEDGKAFNDAYKGRRGSHFHGSWGTIAVWTGVGVGVLTFIIVGLVSLCLYCKKSRPATVSKARVSSYIQSQAPVAEKSNGNPCYDSYGPTAPYYSPPPTYSSVNVRDAADAPPAVALPTQVKTV